MEIMIFILAFLVILLVVITLVGHAIWLIAATIIKALRSKSETSPYQTLYLSQCPNCSGTMASEAAVCSVCGVAKPSGITLEWLSDLQATRRQIERFHRSGVLDTSLFETLTERLEDERLRLLSGTGPFSSPATSSSNATQSFEKPRSVVTEPITTSDKCSPLISPLAVVTSIDSISVASDPISPVSSCSVDELIALSDDRETSEYPPKPIVPSPHRKPLTEVIAAFMEESNIRWGEIIGGLLIIGCSTALVVSLWAEISQIPVLKFLIFTTVTTALFGVGLYTEHRWKLPTTSRGILTIATLLVPLNFLAIAAVSAGNLPPDMLVIASELIAPAVFLCLVYFAGRVLTPVWPHLLTAGVLGSSIGQLLVHHFASPEASPVLMVALGAFPIACYAGGAAWMMRQVATQRALREEESTSIFITLGAITFAAVLPFGLLLYKSGPIGITMMYLAPLVSVAGLPALTLGTVLWRRITSRALLAQQTAGTTLAILGTLTVLLGIILAWPNPASIIPAALLNFAVFSLLAIWLRIPCAHFIASLCLAVAYLVFFHVLAGHVSWQNLRVTSLLEVSVSASSGQALALMFLVYLAASEGLRRKKREWESRFYLWSTILVATISLSLTSVFGLGISGDPLHLSFIFTLYSLGAFWIGTRWKLTGFNWIGSGLLLTALAQAFVQWLNVLFPWQTAFLMHATLCTAAAIVTSRYEGTANGAIAKVLNQSSIISSLVAVLCLLQAREWQTTPTQAERVWWLTSIGFGLLWLNRHRVLFTLFQVALTCGSVLSVKAVLQQYDWYEYLPHAFLHPWSLQIQGTVLVLVCLAWTMLRFVTKRVAESFTTSPTERNAWAVDAWRLLDARLALDRMLSWGLLGGLVLLAVYGAWSGIFQELTSAAHETYVWNIAGFPHEEAFGLGSWILMGLLVIAMLLNFRERGRRIYALGAVAGVTTVIPFAAAYWEGQFATASAWRWLAAGFLLLASLPIWFRIKLSEQFNLQTGSAGQLRDLCQSVRGLLLAITLVPLAVLTAYPALKAVYYMPVHGPSSGIYSLLDARVSYGVPLVLVSLALIGYAWREKLPKYAFVGGLFFNITATMVYLLSVVAVNGSMNRVVLVHTIQLNAIVSALYALVWLSTRNRWVTRLEPDRVRKVGFLLGIQIGICIVANALLIIPVAIKLVLRPDLAGIGTFEVGSIRGWIAFLLTVVGAAWLVREPVKSLKAGYLFATLCGASCLIAFTAARWDTANWTGFHTLIVGTVLTSFVMLLARSLPLWRNEAGNIPSWQQKFSLRLVDDWQRDCGLLATAGGLFVVLLSFRARFAEPSTAWWSIAPLLGMTGLFAALHWQTLKRIYLYAAVVQFCSAALFWWKMQFPVLVPGESEGMQAILISLPASSILWLAMELRARRLAPSTKSTAFSLHNVAALGSLLCMAFVVLLGLLFDAAGTPAPHPAWSDWLSMASILALLIACLWDSRAKHSVASLYFAGLLTIGLTLDQLDLAPHRLAWAGTVALALFCVVASLAWRCRAQILNLTDRLGIPRRIDSTVTGLRWLIDFNVTGVLVVGMAAYWIDLSFLEWPLRFTASLAVLSQAITFALLAEGAGRGRWQRAAIAMSLMGLVFIGWSWLTPTINGTWLNRAVILMVQMFLVTAAYGLFLQKRIEQKSEWVRSFRACVPGVLVAGTVALIFTLCTEVFYQLNFGAVRINQVSLIAVGLTLITAVVTFVTFALSPHLDPLELSEIGRMKYVYAAEVMLALLFMHVRLTLPWLFTGFFEDYWPFVLMAIAYLGVIASEVLRRRNLLVLARPIERTGAFLPLLPVLAFWVAQSNVDYSVLLFLVGGIYGGLSILRKSFAFGLFAAIAGNGGLWFLLHRTQNYGFLQHPQLWLIPVALSILVAAHLNRERYSEDQITGVRYYSLLMIYASSTADIFLNGVADSPWLPLILAALSLCGVFAGISLRIRGLLLLGSVFLLLAIVTMIYYASVNLGWTWLWYIAGIVTGATIIFMFAVFEKKRGEVLRVVEGLKEWES